MRYYSRFVVPALPGINARRRLTAELQTVSAADGLRAGCGDQAKDLPAQFGPAPAVFAIEVAPFAEVFKAVVHAMQAGQVILAALARTVTNKIAKPHDDLPRHGQ